MEKFDTQLLKQLYIPPADSHKGQNGKLLLIGGSPLFHASPIWSLEIASRIVDMVFFASVPQNNQIIQNAKEQFKNGLVIREEDINNYATEADTILIGPGMEREDYKVRSLEVLDSIEEIKERASSEGEKTFFITKYLMKKWSKKKWVIDAGALQMLDLSDLVQLNGNVILTPHHQEFKKIFEIEPTSENAKIMARKYNCVIVLKGKEDFVCSPDKSIVIEGGNAGMTKGGTGDVLAGLIAALSCKNEIFLSSAAGSYINKKAGDSLFEKVGYYFNSTDLVKEIPVVMKRLIAT